MIENGATPPGFLNSWRQCVRAGGPTNAGHVDNGIARVPRQTSPRMPSREWGPTQDFFPSPLGQPIESDPPPSILRQNRRKQARKRPPPSCRLALLHRGARRTKVTVTKSGEFGKNSALQAYRVYPNLVTVTFSCQRNLSSSRAVAKPFGMMRPKPSLFAIPITLTSEPRFGRQPARHTTKV